MVNKKDKTMASLHKQGNFPNFARTYYVLNSARTRVHAGVHWIQYQRKTEKEND